MLGSSPSMTTVVIFQFISKIIKLNHQRKVDKKCLSENELTQWFQTGMGW